MSADNPENKPDGTDGGKGDEPKGGTFDMYHFFSRWDVIAVVALIVALLIFLVAKLLTGPVGV